MCLLALRLLQWLCILQSVHGSFDEPLRTDEAPATVKHLEGAGGTANMSAGASGDGGHFLYFAFGSNLLRERLQLANPSAAFRCTGRLKDYKLNFGLWKEHVDNSWHGGVATIESCPGAEVWGVIWTLSNENLSSLDSQEGVSKGIYSPLQVTVETELGPLQCRTYQMNSFHTCPPSPQYKQVVCSGAEQNGLPATYLKMLEAVETNSYSGPSILDQIRSSQRSAEAVDPTSGRAGSS